MSIVHLFGVCLVALLCAVCNTGSKKSFIPGSYVRYAELKHDEDSHTRLYDTLEIVRSGKLYRVSRRYKAFKVLDGKTLEPEYKVRHWTGQYNDATGTLLVNERGKVISFYRESNTITMGGLVYKKIRLSYEADNSIFPVNAFYRG